MRLFKTFRSVLLQVILPCASLPIVASEVIRSPLPLVTYQDGRPVAEYRLEAKDQGIIYHHGNGPNQCDLRGARDVWVWQHAGKFYMHYDGAGPKGWLACFATGQDAEHWNPRGPVLDFGEAGSSDAASASYGTTFFDGRKWHMFYLGTPHVSPDPNLVPCFPYLTMKADSTGPAGPWVKRYKTTPFLVKSNSYYASCASPGFIVPRGNQYLMFFSASTDAPILRTLGLARTRDLNGSWEIQSGPILPQAEQIENSSLYFEKKNRTWFLFTNHVGIKDGLEYTDAIWVYWSRDLTKWNRAHKAVVLDSRNCTWSKHIIGLPSVLQAGRRLAVFYDGSSAAEIPRGDQSHMERDIGLAWLELPLAPPTP